MLSFELTVIWYSRTEAFQYNTDAENNFLFKMDGEQAGYLVQIMGKII